MNKELPTCPVEITMGLIGDKWKVLIIVPPKVEYSLTDTGLSLKPILDSMVKWENIPSAGCTSSLTVFTGAGAAKGVWQGS